LKKTSKINCRIDNDLKKWFDDYAIAKGLSHADCLREIIVNLKTGKLVDSVNNKETREDKKLELQVDKTKWNILKMKSEIIRNGADTDFKRALVDQYRNKNKALPEKIQKMDMKLMENSYDKNPIRDDGIMCIECGNIFTCDMQNQKDVSEVIQIYMNHIFDKHRDKLLIEEEVRLFEATEKFSIK